MFVPTSGIHVITIKQTCITFTYLGSNVQCICQYIIGLFLTRKTDWYFVVFINYCNNAACMLSWAQASMSLTLMWCSQIQDNLCNHITCSIHIISDILSIPEPLFNSLIVIIEPCSNGDVPPCHYPTHKVKRIPLTPGYISAMTSWLWLCVFYLFFFSPHCWFVSPRSIDLYYYFINAVMLFFARGFVSSL